MNIRSLPVPILQAPIEATAPLAVAVSNAGGVGSIGLTWTETDAAARLVEEISTRTENPFFANFVLAFDPRAFDAVIEAGVPAITLSWGLAPELVERAHRRDVPVGVQVGSVEGARAAMATGADFIICQGVEAGGHVQSTTELSKLLPRVLEVADDVPVVAAGGLSDAKDVTWALGLGATAVMLGTRFVATAESEAHPHYKAALVAAKGADTVSTTCFDGGWPHAPHRVIRNQLFNAWEAAGCPSPGKRPEEGHVLSVSPSGGEIKTYHFSNPMADMDVGNVSEWCLYAGLGCEKIDDVPSVAELIPRLWSG